MDDLQPLWEVVQGKRTHAKMPADVEKEWCPGFPAVGYYLNNHEGTLYATGPDEHEYWSTQEYGPGPRLKNFENILVSVLNKRQGNIKLPKSTTPTRFSLLEID